MRVGIFGIGHEHEQINEWFSVQRNIGPGLLFDNWTAGGLDQVRFSGSIIFPLPQCARHTSFSKPAAHYRALSGDLIYRETMPI